MPKVSQTCGFLTELVGLRIHESCMSHTDPSNPSQSLIKSIVNPEVYKFSSKATAWGCKHEKKAHNVYSKRMVENHHGFSVITDDKKFYLKRDTSGNTYFDHTHAYYCK